MIDAAPDVPAQQRLSCPQSAAAVSSIEGHLLGANATHFFYTAQGSPDVVRAATSDGASLEVPAAPSGFGRHPAFTDHAYLSLDESGNAIATVDLQAGLLPRIVRLAPGRKVARMIAVGQDAVVLHTVADTVPWSAAALELYRAGAAVTEPLLDSAALGSVSELGASREAVVWTQTRGEESVVKKLSLTTRTVSELLTTARDTRLQVAGEWFFLTGVGGQISSSTRRHSLATGELLTTYSRPTASLFVSFIAASPTLIFGAGFRELDFTTGCYSRPPLYNFMSSGGTGTIQPMSPLANGPLVLLGDHVIFSEEHGGDCGGNGGSGGVPHSISVNCWKLGE